jgi:hypothetical protein
MYFDLQDKIKMNERVTEWMNGDEKTMFKSLFNTY